jgi:hypothetical protein
VHTLFGPFLPSVPHPFLLPPTSLTCSWNCSAIFSNFVEEKIQAIIRKKSVFATWDKNSYTQRFLALLPCTSVLQSKLIHFYLTFLLVPDHLPKLTSVIFTLLY